MSNISLWKSISEKPVSYPSLTENMEVDVAIIGGGITGITAAMSLVQQGKKVAVLEQHKVGEGTTGYSTGNLYVAVQVYYQNIVSKFDKETAKIVADSRNFAMDVIENIVKEKNIKCNFTRRPWYLYTDQDKQISFLEKEVETLKQLNHEINFVESMPLAFKFKKAALMKNQARLNPLQYVISLAEDIKKQGCHIFEDTRVINIKEDSVCEVETEKAKVIAKKVIIATHTPTGINATQLFLAPYRSYAVAVRTEDNDYPEGHFWDLSDPHHATCTHSRGGENPELLVVAGNHHKVGQAADAELHYKQLEQFLQKRFSVKEIAYRWSAQHYQAADKIPYIGLSSRHSKHVYLATGFFADGLLYGTLAGLILSNFVSQDKPLDSKPYNSLRFDPMRFAPDFVKENTNVFLQYLKDLPFILPNQYDDIKTNEGKIVEIDQEKWAVSRDSNNKLHIVSAVCTHMKCIVKWNNAENTWDCPCHGSRFTQEGKVIEGPARIDLEKKEN